MRKLKNITEFVRRGEKEIDPPSLTFGLYFSNKRCAREEAIMREQFLLFLVRCYEKKRSRSLNSALLVCAGVLSGFAGSSFVVVRQRTSQSVVVTSPSLTDACRRYCGPASNDDTAVVGCTGYLYYCFIRQMGGTGFTQQVMGYACVRVLNHAQCFALNGVVITVPCVQWHNQIGRGRI